MRRQGFLVVVVVALTACGHATPHVTATPRTSLVDQPVSIEVSGVPPATLVRLSVAEDGWVGSGVFRSDRRGRVSPARQASLRGTYTGRAPMGLFWSMASGFGLGPYFGGTVRVTATALAVNGAGFLGRYYRPAPGTGKHVPVLLIGGSEGGLSNLFLSYTSLLKIQSQLPRGRVVATIYQHAGHFVDTAIPYLPFDDSYYNEALGVTETLGGTSAGESTARADEWPRILRFVGSTAGV